LVWCLIGDRLNLNVFERLLLRNIVPQIQGWNFGHIKEAREMLEDLFTPEEEKQLNIQVEGQKVIWQSKDNEGNDIPQTKEIIISDGLKEKIAKFLKDLDQREQLGLEHYSLYEKFIGGKNG
jgi:hypothetical protein